MALEFSGLGLGLWATIPGWRLLSWCSGKESAYNAKNTRDMDSIPGPERSVGVGNGNPLQDSCLKNPMDRGAWGAIVHGVAKSQL